MPDEKARRTDEVTELLDTVKAYAKQETVTPLAGGAKALGLGLAGAITLGVGLTIVLIAILRLLQTETTAFHGDWMSVIPYVIVFIFAVVAIVVSLSLVKRAEPPVKEPR